MWPNQNIKPIHCTCDSKLGTVHKRRRQLGGGKESNGSKIWKNVPNVIIFIFSIRFNDFSICHTTLFALNKCFRGHKKEDLAKCSD